MTIATYSYGLATCAYVVLSALMLTVWRARLPGTQLQSAVAATALWAALQTWQPSAFHEMPALWLAAETTKSGLWLHFLLRILGRRGAGSLPRWIARAVYLLLASLLLAAAATAASLDLRASLIPATEVVLVSGLILALLGLLLVELAIRNTRRELQRSSALLWIGIGGLFAYDLLLYAIGEMFQRLPATLWEARGAVTALLALLIGRGVAGIERRQEHRLISHRLVFYTTGLTAVGIYLLLVAAAGVYLRVVGGSWGGFLQILFGFGAALLIAILVMSGRARASLQVVVAKYLHPQRFDYLREWLRLVKTMSPDSDDRPLNERAITALAQLVGAPAGGLWLRADDDSFVPAGGALGTADMAPVPANAQFTGVMVEREWIIDLKRENAGVRLDTSPSTGQLSFAGWERARYVVPLLQENSLIGYVLVAEPLVPHELTWEDIDLLRVAGRQVAGYLALDRAARLLAQAQQFDAYNRFVAFVMHDLTNLIANQRLVVENALRFKGRPEFIDDAISTIDSSVKRMSNLLEQLRQGSADAARGRVNVGQVCRSVAQRCSDHLPLPEVSVADAALEVELSSERLTSVLEHVVRNAQDATDASGSVRIEVRRREGRAVVEIVDNGSGMDAAFVRDRLFRPFDSTKGSRGMGIGAYQAREFVRAARGEVRVRSEPGVGTSFEIELPALGDGRA